MDRVLAVAGHVLFRLATCVCILLIAPFILNATLLTIQIQPVEQKGFISYNPPDTTVYSFLNGYAPPDEWLPYGGAMVRANQEGLIVNTPSFGRYTYNIYPAKITINGPPDLYQPVSIPFFMAVKNLPGDTQYQPLPSNVQLTSASMRDNADGWHAGTIDSFFDVFFEVTLPGPHGEIYQWDTTGFQPGAYADPFYLVRVEMQVGQFVNIPEPAAWALVAGILLLACLWRRSTWG